MSNEACHSSEIVGVSFSLHPMCNQFIDIILGTLEKVDSTKVWMRTDDVTTTIRGKAVHVFDVSKAIFIIAAQTGEHIAYQATYSIGCPGDAAGDVYLAEDDEPANLQAIQNIQQEVSAKFSLYPLGGVHYMDMIYKQIDAMKAYVHVSPAHYSTYLRGSALHIFDGLEKVFNQTVASGSSHTVMTVTISANSPSLKGGSADETMAL